MVFDGKTSCERESTHFVSKESDTVQKTGSLKQETAGKEGRLEDDDDYLSPTLRTSMVKRERNDLALSAEREDYEKNSNSKNLPPLNLDEIPLSARMCIKGDFKNMSCSEDLPLSSSDRVSLSNRKLSANKFMKENVGTIYKSDVAPLSARMSIKREHVDVNISDDSDSVEKPYVISRNVKAKREFEVKVITPPRNSDCRQQKQNKIQRARQRAEELQKKTEKSFLVVMARSDVYGCMKLGIPKHWWYEVIKSKSDKCMKLRIKGRVEYDSQLYFCRYDESKCSGTIRTGWKKFVHENSLYEFDCCVFSLAKPLEEKHELIHMEVDIIRAKTS